MEQPVTLPRQVVEDLMRACNGIVILGNNSEAILFNPTTMKRYLEAAAEDARAALQSEELEKAMLE